MATLSPDPPSAPGSPEPGSRPRPPNHTRSSSSRFRVNSPFRKLFGSRDPSPSPSGSSVVDPLLSSTSSAIATPASGAATPASPPTPTGATTPTTVIGEKDSLWTQAFARLDPKSKLKLGITSTTIDRTILDEILTRATQKRDLCTSRQWKLTFGQREVVLRDVYTNITSFIDQFKDVGELVAAIDPIHAGLPWAGLSVLLQLSVNDAEVMAALLVGVEFATSCIARGGFYEALYITPDVLPSDQIQGLKDVLVDLYESILEFLAKMIGYLDHNTAVRFLAGSMRETFKDIQAIVETNEATVRKHADIADSFLASQNFASMEKSSKENFDNLHRILEDMKEPIAVITRKLDEMKVVVDENLEIARETHKLVQKAMNDKSRKVLSATISWISRVDPQKRYRQLRDARQPGSGNWLVECEEVERWMDLTDGEKSFLWLQGRAGSGKSMQCATLSHHLKESRPPDHPFLEFYCDYSENRDVATPDYILKSLLAQICGFAEDVPAKVKAAYQESQMTGLPLDMSNKELASEISTMLKLYPSATVVVDALDECPDPKALFSCLYAVYDGVDKSTDLRMLVTSRDNMRPLRASLRTAPEAKVLDMTQKLDAINKDIRIFLEKKMEVMIANDDFTVVIDEEPEIQKDILDTLSSASDGIILYASLLLLEFSRIPTKSKLRTAIATPPVGLHALFVNCLTRIRSDTWFLLDTAQKVCLWILTAKRPLHIDELREAISIEPDNHVCWDDDNFVEKRHILECAAGLVVMDEDQKVRFVHGSLKEFFEGDCPFSEEDELAGFFYGQKRRDEIIVRASFGYLKWRDFESGPSKSLEELKKRLADYSFLEYASKFWYKHMQGALETEMQSLFDEFLSVYGTNLTLNAWLEVLFTDTEEFRETSKYHFNFDCGNSLPYGAYPTDYSIESLRIHLVCMFGFTNLLQACIDNGNNKLISTATNQRNQTCLYVALAWKQYEVAEKVIPLMGPRSINIKSSSGYTAMHLAASSGRLELVESLVEHGSYLKLEANETKLLSIASRLEDISIADYLISKGLDVNRISPDTGFFPLYYACAAGRADTVKLLLKSGASPMQRSTDSLGLTPVHIAATAGDEKIVAALLEGNGTNDAANIGSLESGSTPLMVTDSAAVTKVLLQHGADPARRNFYGLTAFDVSQTQNRVAVIKEILSTPEGKACLALKREVPTNLVDADEISYLQKPLAVALYNENAVLADLILQTASECPGLNILVNAEDWGATELEIAIVRNKVELLKILLARGFDANVKVGGRTPLLGKICQYPLSEARDPAIIKELLDNGADINGTDEKGGTALHYASYIGTIEIAKVLLTHGASANIPNIHGATPLHSAADGEMLELLLKYGGDITALDSLQQSIVHFAANSGRPSVLKYILNELPPHIPLLSTPQSAGLYPLTFAIHSGHLSCAQLLLSLHDLSWTASGGNTFLHSAVEGPNKDILHLLTSTYRQRNFDLNPRNGGNAPPLAVAAALKKADYVQYLLDAGADALLPWPSNDLAPVFPMVSTYFPLAILTEDESFDAVIAVFLNWARRNGKLDIRDSCGNGMLHYCTDRPGRVRRLVVEEGVDAGMVNGMGDSVLHLAARMGGGRYEGLVGVCGEMGVDLGRRNAEGMTAGEVYAMVSGGVGGGLAGLMGLVGRWGFKGR